MTDSRYVPAALRRKVAADADHQCGYCCTAQRVSGAPMHVEHIIPLAQGGTSEESNLWLSCAWCNSFKGVQTHALDEESEARVLLFNPRAERWAFHFRWSDDGTLILGMTPTGRATVQALQMNNEWIVPARRLWVSAGWHPPSE